jgi:hypothetical protein
VLKSGRSVRQTNTAICEPIVDNVGASTFQPLWASMACYRDSFTFLYIGLVVKLLYKMSSPRFQLLDSNIFRSFIHFVVWTFPIFECNPWHQITLPYWNRLVCSVLTIGFNFMSIDSETLELSMGTCVSSVKTGSSTNFIGSYLFVLTISNMGSVRNFHDPSSESIIV